MKKSLCILCSTATALSLAACGTAQVSAGEAAETTTVSTEELTTVTGKVTAIEGTSVTLALGEVSENSEENTAPEMPSRISFTENGETLTLDISEAAITLNDQTLTADDIYVDDILELTVDSSNTAATVIILSSGNTTMGQPGGNGAPGGNGGFGGSSEVTQGDSATTITEDGTYTGTIYTSTGDDENALRVDGAAVTLDGITVDKQSGATSNTENGDFYGMNAALLATNGATVTIKNATVTSSAQNGNGVFSYGSGTTVNISDSTITTTADNSGVTLKNLDSDSAFLRVVGNSASHGWGTAGSNGAQVEFTADSQTIDGDIVVDTISTLDFSLTNGSVLNGTINFNGYTITLADGTVLK